MENKNDKLIEGINIETNLDDVSDDLKEYYSQLSQKIIKLINEKKIKEAIDLIDEELDSPYIPNSIFVTLSTTRSELEYEYKHEQYEKNIASMTPLQIWDKIYDEKTGNFDIAYYTLLLERKEFELDDVDCNMIQKMLNDKKVDNTNKLAIALSIISSGKEFDIYNNNLKQSFHIDFKDQNSFSLPDTELVSKLEDHFMKDPSKFQIGLNIIQLLYVWFFPTKPSFNNDEIIESTINMVENSFGNEPLKENGFTKIIHQMLEENES